MAVFNLLALVDAALAQSGCPYDRDSLHLDARPPAAHEVAVAGRRVAWTPGAGATAQQIAAADAALLLLDGRPRRAREVQRIADDIAAWVQAGADQQARLNRLLRVASTALAIECSLNPAVARAAGIPVDGDEV